MRTSPFSSKLRKNQTDAEKLLWLKIRSKQIMNKKFRRQHSIPPYIVDFVSLEDKLIIELDGGEHNTEKGKKYDSKRTTFLKSKGYRVIRFWNNDILMHIDEVLEVIYFNLQPSSQPSPYR